MAQHKSIRWKGEVKSFRDRLYECLERLDDLEKGRKLNFLGPTLGDAPAIAVYVQRIDELIACLVGPHPTTAIEKSMAKLHAELVCLHDRLAELHKNRAARIAAGKPPKCTTIPSPSAAARKKLDALADRLTLDRHYPRAHRACHNVETAKIAAREAVWG